MYAWCLEEVFISKCPPLLQTDDFQANYYQIFNLLRGWFLEVFFQFLALGKLVIRWVIGRVREFRLVSLNCNELFTKVNANLKCLRNFDMLEMLRNWINHQLLFMKFASALCKKKKQPDLSPFHDSVRCVCFVYLHARFQCLIKKSYEVGRGHIHCTLNNF